MFDRIKNNNGFTLVELVVSMGILLFMIVGFMNMFVNSANYLGIARNNVATSYEVQELIDESINKSGEGTSEDLVAKSTTLVIHLNPDNSYDVNLEGKTITAYKSGYDVYTSITTFIQNDK